jgi:hypothetical protein
VRDHGESHGINAREKTGFWTSLNFAAAMVDIQVASARRDAILYYREFIDSFRSPPGPGGALPGGGGGGKNAEDRVEDATSERYLMQASFALGRLLSRGSDM